MSSPAAGNTPQTRPDISGSMYELDTMLDSLGLIAHRVLPIWRTQVPANQFGVIPIESILRNPNTLRNAKAGYNQSNWEFEVQQFATIDRGVKGPVDDRERRMYANFFDAEVVTAEVLALQMALDYEYRVATKVFNATTWTGAALSTTLGTPWSTHASADPVEDVRAAKLKSWLASGQYPDTMIVTQEAFDHLKQCTAIKDASKSQGFMDVRPERITAAIMAVALDLRQVIIAGSPKNTAQEGQPAEIASVWDRTMAMVCKVADSDNIKMPCIGRTFLWDERSGDLGNAGLDVRTWQDADGETDWVRVRHDSDEKIIRPQNGHLLKSVIA